MIKHALRLAPIALAGMLVAITAPAVASPPDPSLATALAKGVLRVKSIYGFDDTVTRLKADIASKGIKFFDEIDQSQLGAGANIALRPSKLLIFGNPPLGVQFLTANAVAGLDWPVRMLVAQGADGGVWVAWTDFGFIKDRYALADRDPALKMATEVSTSIASSVTH